MKLKKILDGNKYFPSLQFRNNTFDIIDDWDDSTFQYKSTTMNFAIDEDSEDNIEGELLYEVVEIKDENYNIKALESPLE